MVGDGVTTKKFLCPKNHQGGRIFAFLLFVNAEKADRCKKQAPLLTSKK